MLDFNFGARRAMLGATMFLAFTFGAAGAVHAQAAAQAAAPAAIPPGSLTYVGAKINASNLDRSLDFYTRIIGLKIAAHVGDEVKGEVIMTTTGKLMDEKFVVVYDRNRKDPPVLGNVFTNLIFGVDDLQLRIDALKAAGYVITRTAVNDPRRTGFKSIPAFPKAVTFVEMAWTKDPDGVPVELVQWNYSCKGSCRDLVR